MKAARKGLPYRVYEKDKKRRLYLFLNGFGNHNFPIKTVFIRFTILFIGYNLLALGSVYLFHTPSEFMGWILMLFFALLSMASFFIGVTIESLLLLVMLCSNWILFNWTYPTEIKTCLGVYNEKKIRLIETSQLKELSFVKIENMIPLKSQGGSEYSESFSNDGASANSASRYFIPLLSDSMDIKNNTRIFFAVDYETSSLLVDLGLRHSNVFKALAPGSFQGIFLTPGSVDYELCLNAIRDHSKKKGYTLSNSPVLLQWLPDSEEYYTENHYLVQRILLIELICWILVFVLVRAVSINLIVLGKLKINDSEAE